MSTRLTRFTWARPVQANAQCYEFPILHFHLTQVQQTNMLILLDRRAKEKSIEQRNSKWREVVLISLSEGQPKDKKGFGNGKEKCSQYDLDFTVCSTTTEVSNHLMHTLILQMKKHKFKGIHSIPCGTRSRARFSDIFP